MAGLFRYRDMKAQAYEPVWQSVNSATAIRESQAHLEAGRISPTYASDYALFQVGEEDPVTGRIESMEPKHILDLVELING